MGSRSSIDVGVRELVRVTAVRVQILDLSCSIDVVASGFAHFQQTLRTSKDPMLCLSHHLMIYFAAFVPLALVDKPRACTVQVAIAKRRTQDPLMPAWQYFRFL